MIENYKVSIIVPIYNVEKYLEECIDSLIKQTYRNIEIILVDDGSKDSSGIICDKYAKIDNRVIVIHKENGGQSSAREAGIFASSGEYIMTVDGDDWIDIDTVEVCINEINKYDDIDCVIYSYMKEFPNNSVPMHIMDNSIVFSPKEAEDKVYRRLFGLLSEELRHPERMDNIVSCCMKLYKSEVAKKGRFFDIKVIGSSEDNLFNMYALHNCGTVVYIDRCLYHYRKIETSSTRTYRQDLEKKWGVLFSIMEEIIKEKNLPEKYLDALSNRIAFSIIGVGMNEIGNKNKTYLEKIKKIKKYLKSSCYRKACKKLTVKNMPVIWKMFFYCCKYQMSIPVYFMILGMTQLRKR